MAGENDDPTKGDPKPDPDKGGTDLGDAGKRALDQERKARRDAEAKAADLAKRLEALEDQDKSEVEKLRKENAQLKSDLAASASKADRLEVALAKGLTAAQAKRLVGSTREELESDADEILETFGGKPSGKDDGDGGDGGKSKGEGDPPRNGPPSQQPKPALRGGSDPTNQETEETDPRKLAALIPRA